MAHMYRGYGLEKELTCEICS